MKISGNELAVTVKKACIGAGVAQGVAVDMGRACLALALADREPLGSLLIALENFDKDQTLTVWERCDSGWTIAWIDALRCGPSVVDFARLSEKTQTVTVDDCDHPDLIWGLFATSGFAFDFERDGNGIKASLSDDPADCFFLQSIGGLQVDDEKWEELQNFAKAILVPADEMNRADAGAGNTDND